MDGFLHQASFVTGNWCYDRHCSVRLVICFDLAIDQIAQSGLSSLKVIYYSAQLFSITGADVLFSGEADTLTPTLLKLTDTGGSGGMATGIAVQILDAQSQQEIPLNQVQPLTPLKAGDNTLKYQLRYKSTKAGATGGNATAVLYFDLVYQ
ncbi:fimbrial protein [Shigella sonnei]|nr:fimbrial protein [Shigella sonnei]